MKKVRMVFTLSIFAVIGALMIALPPVANALDCAVVSINRIGVDPRFEGPPIQLKDVNGVCWGSPGAVRQFYLSSSLGNQGLATILSAYSMDKTLWVRVAGDGSAGSLITVLFIND
jgi:hypothetical protein